VRRLAQLPDIAWSTHNSASSRTKPRCVPLVGPGLVRERRSCRRFGVHRLGATGSSWRLAAGQLGGWAAGRPRMSVGQGQQSLRIAPFEARNLTVARFTSGPWVQPSWPLMCPLQFAQKPHLHRPCDLVGQSRPIGRVGQLMAETCPPGRPSPSRRRSKAAFRDAAFALRNDDNFDQGRPIALRSSSTASRPSYFPPTRPMSHGCLYLPEVQPRTRSSASLHSSSTSKLLKALSSL
jgi:hypothetical protein